MAEKVTKLALASRLIVLVLQLVANLLIRDHKADVFRTPVAELSPSFSFSGQNSTLLPPTWLDRMTQFCLGGLRHWDAEYFLHIAEHSYTYEQTLAFYPLYPMLIGSAASALHYLNVGLSMRSCTLIVAVLINLFCFCKATNVLYDLTQRLFKDSNKSWYTALLFCFNPASIFFSAAYSETLFALLTFQLMYECVSGMRFIRYTFTLSASILCRSNGLVNLGFPLYYLFRKWLINPATNLCATIFKMLLCAILAILPLTVFYSYAFQQFCLKEREMNMPPAVVAYAQERSYVLAGSRQPNQSPWCDQLFPFPYSYIQQHYWNVGFLRYYELKQLPNFLLALPILWFLYKHCWMYLRYFQIVYSKTSQKELVIKECGEWLPFLLHALFLTIFCTFFVHIQVSTRMLCSATPVLYWFAADHMPKSLYEIRWRSKPGAILLWFGFYYLMGTILFSNNLPWT